MYVVIWGFQTKFTRYNQVRNATQKNNGNHHHLRLQMNDHKHTPPSPQNISTFKLNYFKAELVPNYFFHFTAGYR